MTEKKGKAVYRCGHAQCQVTAEIDWDQRTKVIKVPHNPANPGFPTHPGCELAKSIDEIEEENLERLP